jgi:glyceraldehyde-3-phosphate dehydrogenase (ferredoxin)
VHTFIKRFKEVENGIGEDLDKWLAYFDKDKHAAALDFWYEMHKGSHESLREFK